MVTPYDSAMLEREKEGLLGLYIENLEELVKGKVPVRFNMYARMFEAAIPFFPEADQPKYRKLVKDGLVRAEFLRAKQIVDATKDTESERLDSIKSLLAGLS